MLMRTTISIVALGLALAAPSAKAARTFCCADGQGKRICSDVLPDVCVNKPYSEFNERGIRGPDHDAPLTDAQMAARDAEAKKKRDADKVALDQQRRDQALLSTYATEADLNAGRDRAVGEVERNIKQVQDKLDLALKDQKKLANDVSQYKAKGEEIPQDVKEQVSRNNLEVKGQQEALVNKKQEVEQIKAKFETDRGRLRELRGIKATDDAAKPAADAGKAAAAKP
jgi:hypothetical protein